MKLSEKTGNILFPMLGIIYAAAEYFWGVWYYRGLYQKGLLLSAADVTAETVLPMLRQHFIISIPVFAMIGVSLLFFRKELAAALLCRKKHGEKRLIAVGSAGIIYIIMLGAALLGGRATKLSVFYQWVYYLFFVALVEELSFRFFVPMLLEKGHLPKWCLWVIPGILFGFMHTTIPVVKNGLTAEILVNGLSMIGGGIMGNCFFYYLRCWSGTIWLPVLIHAALDYAGIFG